MKKTFVSKSINEKIIEKNLILNKLSSIYTKIKDSKQKLISEIIINIENNANK